jgi:hypothetical protein
MNWPIIEAMQADLFSPLDISERLRRYRPQLEANWNEILSELPELTRKQYIDSLKQERDPARRLLFLYFLYCGAMEAEIRYQGNTYFYMGLPLDARRIPLLAFINSDSGHPQCMMSLNRHSVDAVQPILENEILPLARRILLYDTTIPGRNWIDYLRMLESFIGRHAGKLLAEGKPITFAHFRFQNLNHYFGLLGEAGASEMIRNIEQTIRAKMHEGDMTVVLSPHSCIVLSPGREYEEVYQRFQAIYFEIKSLILDYALYVHTIHRPDFSLFNIFRELKI